jgi:Icc-related predicted phosphoesterase
VTKLVIISDTHNKHEKLSLPEGDVLIHCGDITSMGTIKEVASFAKWFRDQDYKYKILVAGNHDFLFEDNNSLARGMFDHDNIYYLEDSGIEIEGMLFYGSPWIPPIFNWAFMLDEDKRRMKWCNIPSVTEVLITHTPPRGIKDYIYLVEKSEDPKDHEHLGCIALRDRLRGLAPSVHCFGHIHEGYGIEEKLGTKFVNASSCDEEYKIVNKPIEIEI